MRGSLRGEGVEVGRRALVSGEGVWEMRWEGEAMLEWD